MNNLEDTTSLSCLRFLIQHWPGCLRLILHSGLPMLSHSMYIMCKPLGWPSMGFFRLWLQANLDVCCLQYSSQPLPQ